MHPHALVGVSGSSSPDPVRIIVNVVKAFHQNGLLLVTIKEADVLNSSVEMEAGEEIRLHRHRTRGPQLHTPLPPKSPFVVTFIGSAMVEVKTAKETLTYIDRNDLEEGAQEFGAAAGNHDELARLRAKAFFSPMSM